MDSKVEMYLQRAQWAARAADGAENSGTIELANLYRKIALLWRDMALMEKRRPANQA